MSRLLAAMKTDMTVQVRNKLYTIGISVGVLIAGMLAWLAEPDQLGFVAPATLLLVVGGSTLLYVAAMILFEKTEGTLDAVVVSPLRTSEYLGSKVATLTLLASVESAVMIGGGMLLMRLGGEVPLPNLPILAAGTALLCIVYTLVGIVSVVRYDSITEFLVPMAAIASVLQLGFLYFLGVVEHWSLLVVPTSAPAMIIYGASAELTVGQWVYAIGYTVVSIGVLAFWARRAFHRHITLKRG
jgi:fluoroquinolone transport system permease protein